MIKFDVTKKTEAERTKYKVYCKCGHSIIFTPTAKTNKTICSHCGHYIYKDEKDKFKELMKRELKK